MGSENPPSLREGMMMMMKMMMMMMMMMMMNPGRLLLGASRPEPRWTWRAVQRVEGQLQRAMVL